MNTDLIKLKVKSKSLAEEGKIIRKEINRIKEIPGHKRKHELSKLLTSLYLHNKQVVAVEARATQLAIAMIKGKPYSYVERNTPLATKLPLFEKARISGKVANMLAKYDRENSQAIGLSNISKVNQWLEAG